MDWQDSSFNDFSSLGLSDISKGKGKQSAADNWDSWDTPGDFGGDSWDTSFDGGFNGGCDGGFSTGQNDYGKGFDTGYEGGFSKGQKDYGKNSWKGQSDYGKNRGGWNNRNKGWYDSYDDYGNNDDSWKGNGKSGGWGKSSSYGGKGGKGDKGGNGDKGGMKGKDGGKWSGNNISPPQISFGGKTLSLGKGGDAMGSGVDAKGKGKSKFQFQPASKLAGYEEPKFDDGMDFSMLDEWDMSGAGMDGNGMDGKGKDGKGMDGKGMDGKGMDKGMDGKGMDKGKDGKGMDKGKDGKGMDKGMDGKGMDKGKDGKGKHKGKDGKGKGGKGPKGPPSIVPPLFDAGGAFGGQADGAIPPGMLVPPAPGMPGIPEPPPGKGPGKGNTVPPPGTLALMPPSGTTVPPPASGLAPELAALMQVSDGGNMGMSQQPPVPPPHVTEKKPRIIVLVTKLAADLKENHLQQILEQCGEVHAWRRGLGPNGEPLSFGFAQFGDPEAAWKVSTCLSKRTLCGQEIKVLVEEQAETIIQNWRESQKAELKVNTDEELDWELERKAVSCKAAIDAKVEEIYGPQALKSDDGAENGSPGAVAQRRQELLDREQKRLERTRKRKAWREEEFLKELARIEELERQFRMDEKEQDEADREKEEAEIREKEAREAGLAKLEERGNDANLLATASIADTKAICELVDRVQSEPRNDIFRMAINTEFLRDNKILDKKLRPWLDKKMDLYMGGTQADVVEYVIRRVNAAVPPEALINDLERYLDHHADAVVERMWRMIVLELTRGGMGLSNKAKRSRFD